MTLDDLNELDSDELEAIASLVGGNELARREARDARDILDNRAEQAYETWLSNYYGGGSPQTMAERHGVAWKEHREAHKR